jgi:polyisoprenoid-binding protein YceI
MMVMRKWIVRLVVLVVVGLGLVYGGILLWTKVIDPPEDRFDADDLAAVVDVTTTTTGSTNSTSVPDTASNPSSPAANDLTGLWMATDGSEVGYRVKEVLGGVDTEGVGRTDAVSGTLTIQGTSIIGTTFEVEVATITSDSTRRDSQFAGPIMNTSEHPTASFQLTQPIELGTIPDTGETITAAATGELTLRGVTRDVTFEVSARLDNGVIGVLGSIDVVFSDYGIANPSNGFVTTGDEGLIEFVLVFAKS